MLSEPNNGSTGNLYRHVRKSHPDKIEEQKQEEEKEFVSYLTKYSKRVITVLGQVLFNPFPSYFRH